jgi:hypothetical protein
MPHANQPTTCNLCEVRILYDLAEYLMGSGWQRDSVLKTIEQVGEHVFFSPQAILEVNAKVNRFYDSLPIENFDS